MAKRKAPSAAPAAPSFARQSASGSRTGPSASGARGAKSAAAFAQPMRLLDDDDEEEEQDEESVARDRAHMRQIDQDVEDAEEEEHEDEDEEDASDADVADDAHPDAGEADGDAPTNGTEDDAEGAPEVESVPLEFDLPLQLVQGTYSGVLYGLKTKHDLRALRAFHTKLHSKRGIEEADIDDEDIDDDDDEEDDEDVDLGDDAAATTNAPASADASKETPTGFDLLFTNAAHIGSLKSLAISVDGKWMVSGGVDETVKIFHTAKMREFGQLHSHSGSVGALEFYGSGFLLSGGQEGDLCIWNTKNWQLLRKFASVHQGGAGGLGGVSCVAVHPSGRVALSVGALDRKVKLWDLMKGTLASERTLDFACTAVRWATDGEHYILLGDKRFEIYDTASKLLRREELARMDTKLHSVMWLSDSLFAIGCEDSTVRIYSSVSGDCVTTLKGHKARVRGLDAITMPVSHAADAPRCTFLATADTTGLTLLWDLTPLVTAPDSNAPSSIEFHPCCSAFHDQRVTQLRILPQWTARKEDASLRKPVETAAAAERQAALEQKKATTAANKSMTKSERAEAQLAKSKKLFEKKQRSLEQKQQAAAKAKRALARLAPGAELADRDASSAAEPPKKKQKATFEEAPLVDSDTEQAQPPRPTVGDEQQEDDEMPAEPAPKSTAASKKKPAAPAKAHSAQPKAKAKAPTAAAKSAPATAAARDESDDDNEEEGHSGFSAAIPLFKPKLNQQRGKKKSARKQQRDAERTHALQQTRR